MCKANVYMVPQTVSVISTSSLYPWAPLPVLPGCGMTKSGLWFWGCGPRLGTNI